VVSGVVEGGWEFVVAAYAVTATVLTLYGTSIFVRLRKEKGRAARQVAATDASSPRAT
jgi:hypothetical protein